VIFLQANLYLIIPCYNEQEVLNKTADVLQKKVLSLIEQKKISPNSKILFVDDGSKDNTWQIINELHSKDKIFSGIKLSRNRGHQNALLAGLMSAKNLCDITISIDADLQDDTDAIDKMIDKYYEGNEIVYGVRSARKTDTFFKKFTAESFYKLIKFLGADIIFNHADFRLMSKKSLESFANFNEVNLFLRGLVPMVGFKSGIVTYERHERFAGESKYPLKKMLSFAWEGITSLSVKPIKLITSVGFFIFFVSILMVAYFLFQFINKNTVAGWTSIVISVWMLGGLQLISIGLIGEYIGKIYIETKHRPKFIIEKFLNE
jgi:Glycosyltransferases involved in cell wall biogenesis